MTCCHLFLEVKKLGNSVGVSLPTGCYRTVCSMDTSKENRDRLFENSDTMVQCRFESTSPLDSEEISSISFHVNRDIFNGVHQSSSHSEHTTPEGKTMEGKYSDDWDEATDIEQHTNEMDIDTDGGVRNFEGKMNNRYETKKADFVEEKESGSKGLHNDDQSDTSEIYQNEELEQPTPIPETCAPLPYAQHNKSQKTSASQQRRSFPATASPTNKSSMEIYKPHPTLDSYNHQIIVQQQLQLQMMQNEIDRLRALIEENGFGVKEAVNQKSK